MEILDKIKYVIYFINIYLMPTLWKILCFIIGLSLWPIIYAKEYGL